MTIFAKNPDLLRRFRVGERSALAKVYWYYIDAVDKWVQWRLTPIGLRRNAEGHADRADMVQDIFMKAFAEKARLAYDPCREYRPYLMAIARNTLVSRLRTSRPEVVADLATLDRLAAPQRDVLVEPSPWADPQTLRLVEYYVSQLAPPERDVYLERYERCRSQKSAAAVLGLTRQQLRTLESRIRGGLAREIARSKLAPASAERCALADPARMSGGSFVGKDHSGS